jgi:hypothetical protein
VDETNQKAKGGKAPQFAPPELAALMDTDWFIGSIFYCFILNIFRRNCTTLVPWKLIGITTEPTFFILPPRFHLIQRP